MFNNLPKIENSDLASPRRLYLLGLCFFLIGISTYVLGNELALFGPIGLTAIIMGYAEQMRRFKGENSIGVLHYVAIIVFITSTVFVLWWIQ